MKSTLKSCVSAMSIVAMSLIAMPAFAQDAPATADEEVTGLDEIVVTASGKDKTQLNSSVSVTSISADTIDDFKPSSEAEIFRMIPGLEQAEFARLGGLHRNTYLDSPRLLDALEAMPRTVDVGAQLPHAALRAYVSGRAAHDDDLVLTFDATQEARFEKCIVCPKRVDMRCSECGCFVDKKTWVASEACPIGQWGRVT